MDTDPAVVEKSVLLVDDDTAFCTVLGGALKRRGFRVVVAHDLGTALLKAQEEVPDIAILDLNLHGQSSLSLIPALQLNGNAIQILMLTGYASIATAVEATKLGAQAYLTKPANIDDILRELQNQPAPVLTVRPVRSLPTDIDKAMQQRLRLVVRECAGNISAAARKLGMHRRSLQRKLKRGTTH